MSAEQMLSILVQDSVVCTPREVGIGDLVGEFNYLGTILQNAENRDVRTRQPWHPHTLMHTHICAHARSPSPSRQRLGWWIPPDPSYAQVRQNFTEYAVLPVGSETVRQQVRSLVSPRPPLYPK